MTNEVSAPVENSPQQPVMPEIYTKSDIDRIRQETANNSFKAGYGKAKQELAEAPAQSMPQQPGNAVPQQVAPPAMTPEMQAMIDQRAAEQVQQHLLHQQQLADQQNKARLAQQGIAKLDAQFAANKDKYGPDLMDKLKNANFGQFEHAVGLATDDAIPNGDAVIMHLAENPLKKAQLNDLAKVDPAGAIIEARRLAESLRQNDIASNLPNTREPLSQLTPSSVGVSKGGTREIADYKNEFRF